MRKTLKSKTHKTMVKPAVEFGSEAWAMNEMDMKGLCTWERKLLR
jgi:hypothetical protein